MNDDCILVDGYAVIVQLFVGIVAISTLLIKRKYEWPQRPWKVWLFDTSKQAFSSASMHCINVLAAYLSDLRSDETGPDQCAWYLTSILIDGTLLLTLMAVLVMVLSWWVERQEITTLRQGEYGEPPNWRIWIQQLVIYALFLFASKAICLWVLYKHSTWYQKVAVWILTPFFGHKKVELLVVMIGIPAVLAILQYWIMDSLLKANWQNMWMRRVPIGWSLITGQEDQSGEAGNDDKDEEEDIERKKENVTLLGSTGISYYVLGSAEHLLVIITNKRY